MRDWRNAWEPSEDAAKAWVAEIGPLVTTLYAGTDFSAYSDGVLDGGDCCDQASDPECK